MLEDGRDPKKAGDLKGTAGAAGPISGPGVRPFGRSDEDGHSYRALLDRLPIGVYRLGPDGRPLLANAALLRMVGAGSLEALLSGEVRWPGHDREALETRLADSEEVLGLESLWTAAGGPIKVRENIRAIRDRQGKLSCYEGTVEDITEGIDTEESLRAKADFLEEVVSNATVGIFVIDEDNRYVLINPECGRIVGLWPDDYTGGEAGLHIHPEDSGKAAAQFIHAISGETTEMEVRIEASDGTYKHCRVILSPLVLGGRSSVLGIVTDRTAQKLSEEELKQKSGLDPVGLMSTLLDRMGKRLPPEALDATFREFQDWFDKRYSSAFEDYMELVSSYDVPAERDIEGPELVLRRFFRFASTMLSGMGFRTETTFTGLEGQFEVLSCPWSLTAGESTVNCHLCNMMIDSGLKWAGLKGTIERRPTARSGPQHCRFVVRIGAQRP